MLAHWPCETYKINQWNLARNIKVDFKSCIRKLLTISFRPQYFNLKGAIFAAKGVYKVGSLGTSGEAHSGMIMIKSRLGNAFRIIGSLWRESIRHRWIVTLLTTRTIHIDYVVRPLQSFHGYPMLNQETSYVTIRGEFAANVRRTKIAFHGCLY